MGDKKEISLRFTSETYYRRCLEAVNGFFGNTPTEITVLSVILELGEDYAFKPSGRKELLERCGLKTKQSLNNIIGGLYKKNLLQRVDYGFYRLHPAISFTTKVRKIIINLDEQ